MLKRIVAAVILAVAAPAAAQDAPPPPPAADVAPVKLTPEQMDKDPRMIAAVRHANSLADRKCGDVGGIVSLEDKAAGRACRKRYVNAARADAEFEINGGK